MARELGWLTWRYVTLPDRLETKLTLLAAGGMILTLLAIVVRWRNPQRSQ